MYTSSSKKTPKKSISRKKILLALAYLLLATAILIDLTVIGNITYVSKWIQCGSKPVVVRSGKQFIAFGGQAPSWNAYTNVGLFDEKIGLVSTSPATLHCSLQEAQNAYDKKLNVQ